MVQAPPPTQLSSGTISSLNEYITSFTSTADPKLPGAIVHVVDKENNPLFSHASGGVSQTLTDTTLFPIYSPTKIIGAIAFLQLVDRGIVGLNDAEVIKKILPELAGKKVLKGWKEDKDTGVKEWEFEDVKAEITPKMLLNHTWGGGHSFFSKPLYEYLDRNGGWETANESNEWWTVMRDAPLLCQPGTKTQYSAGPNWIAVLIERLTGMSLDAYFDENVFSKLGLKNTGYDGQYGGTISAGKMVEDGRIEGTYWGRSMKLRDAGGSIVPTINPPGQTYTEAKKREDVFGKGGKHHTFPLDQGLVSNVVELSRIFSILLPQNNGVDPLTGHRLLSANAVKEITSPQLPSHLRDNSRTVVSESLPDMLFPADLEAEHMDPHGSFGLSCAVQGRHRILKNGKRGRSTGTAYWYGAGNCDFWIDGEKGVVVVCTGNYFPWMDEEWVEMIAGVEGRLYEALGR